MYFTFVLLFRGIFPFSSEFLAIFQGTSSRDVIAKLLLFFFFLSSLRKTLLTERETSFRSQRKIVNDAYIYNIHLSTFQLNTL